MIKDTTSNDAFLPYRGKEEDILEAPLKPGAVYFAWDTKKIYFDEGQSRHVMSGSGIKFIYGDCQDDLMEDEQHESFIPYPRQAVTTAYEDLGRNEEDYHEEDIIINSDGTFYRIKEITPTIAWCEKLLVSGTGGGGGEAASSLSIKKGSVAFVTSLAKGQDLVGSLWVRDTKGTNDVDIYCDYRIEYTDQETCRESSAWLGKLTGAKNEFTITIPAENLQIGKNYISFRAVSNGRVAEGEDGFAFSVMVYDVNFGPQSSTAWNVNKIKRFNTPDSTDDIIKFPYRITAGQGSSLPTSYAVKVLYTVDGVTSMTHTINSTALGEHDLSALFNGLSHGAHTLDYKATMNFNGADVNIGSAHYEIALVNAAKDLMNELVDKAPVIWSPYPHQGEEVQNYEIINIPFMVYDPTSLTNSAEVTYYINGEEINSETIVYNENEYAVWEVATYIPDEVNEFIIKCGETQAIFYVKIVKNYEVNYDAISNHLILHLNAVGRSNNESLLKRSTWNNKATGTAAVGQPVLSGFNWYNNGWVKDADNNTVLRVSNGASVFIPLDWFHRNNTPGTYEFEFKVRNAIDYSKLVNIETVYQRDPETGNIVYDDQGKPVPEQEVDAAGNTHDKVIKRISVDEQGNPGRGAFLTYFDSSKQIGMMLGTQEALVSLNATDICNVRYTDDERTKISFVVDTAEPSVKGQDGVSADNRLIYAYVDGVLTNIMAYKGTRDFTSTVDHAQRGIYINSNYCDVDIYCIRVYETALPFIDITQNYVGDASTLQERKARYDRNQAIADADNTLFEKTRLSYTKTKAAKLMPILTVRTYQSGIVDVKNFLPYVKGGKIAIDAYYYDGNDLSRCWHTQNATIDVQGTSSQGYPRRNFTINLKQKSAEWAEAGHPFKLETWDGTEGNKDIYYDDKNHKLKKVAIGISADHQWPIAEKKFVLKADYMDSSSSHNTPGANLVQALSRKVDDGVYKYDLRHPLKQWQDTSSNRSKAIAAAKKLEDGDPNKIVEAENEELYTVTINGTAFRTTVFGYPCLMFWQRDLVDGSGNVIGVSEPEFIGKYNFNLHKGCTGSFGFTNTALNPFTPVAEHTRVIEVDDTEEEVVQNRHATYDEVCECWEMTNNQAGPSKFQDDGYDSFYDTMTDDSEDSDTAGQQILVIRKHFEARYPEMADENDMEEWRARTSNLHAVWDWTRQTDVTSNKNRTIKPLAEPVYYKTLSNAYEYMIDYYSKDEESGEYTYVAPSYSAALSHIYSEDEELTISETANNTINIGVLLGKIAEIDYPSETGLTQEQLYDRYFGDSEFVYDSSNWKYRAKGGYLELIGDLPDWGIALDTTASEYPSIRRFTITISKSLPSFNINLYEKFEKDTNRYRLSKFRNEFAKHWNVDYTLFYFIYTELLLLYDSRQKNAMFATWGPEEEGGAYIWYPIFYDLDTQLGVNNSGQVYWDYDEDATPDLRYRMVQAQDGTWDAQVYARNNSPTATGEEIYNGSTDSIFSGNGSVLWNNIQILFRPEIQALYRTLRLKGGLDESILRLYYNTNSSDKWPEIVKNLDAYYKYIAPAITGYASQTDGSTVYTDLYYYCLQGDRKRNREAFFRNRLNYLDSEWGGGAYDPEVQTEGIITRYNLNDRVKTSDSDDGTDAALALNSNATYVITPFLSQYVSMVYDQTATTPIKFTLSQDDQIAVTPPASIQKRADSGVALSQQLAYIRGPRYLSDIGDLSLHYLNELSQLNTANRLRRLIVGNEYPGYKNENLTALSIGAKGLLSEVDLTNLSKLTADPDVSGCPKLEILKALGTNFGTLSLPSGSMLKRVYLPATIAELRFVKPLALRRIITNPANAAYQNNTDGLYIEGLTNMLDTEITSSTKSAVTVYQMDDTLMGYDTYRMLKYLYDLKNKVQTGVISENNASKDLRISVQNAYWSPYTVVESGSAYTPSQLTYKLRNYNETFSNYEYTTPSQWAQDVKDGKVYYVNGQGDSPITDLSMLDRFIEDVRNPDVPYLQAYFKPLTDLAGATTTKLVPTISGTLHVRNTSSTPIREVDIFNKYHNDAYFKDLDITADYVESAKRARFVEYAEDGSEIVHYVQKWDDQESSNAAICRYGALTNPQRNHYDFLGWAIDDGTKVGGLTWRERHSVNNDWTKASNDGKIVEPAAYSLDREENLDENGNITFVAVFALHKYIMKYYMDDGSAFTYNDGIHSEPVQVTSYVVAGQPITFTERIPYKDSSGLTDLTKVYHFDGWTSSVTDEIIRPAGFQRAQKDMDFYAHFTLESVYEHPLTENELLIKTITDSGSGEVLGTAVTINPACGLKGRICIPKEVKVDGQTYNVISTLLNSIEEIDGTGKTVTSYTSNLASTDLEAVFFKGCEVTPNDSAMLEFSEGTFNGNPNLKHVDIPSSLTTVQNGCFQNCSNLVITDFKNVFTFGFAACNNMGSNKPGFDVHICAKAVEAMQGGNIRGYAFWQCGMKTFTIGSTSDRATDIAGLNEAYTFGNEDTPLDTFVLYGDGVDQAQFEYCLFQSADGGVLRMSNPDSEQARQWYGAIAVTVY